MFQKLRSFALSSAVAAVVSATSTAASFALPIDDFSVLAGRTFRVYGDVNEAVRSPTTLGSVLSVEIPFGVPNGRIQYGGTGGKGVTVVANPTTPMMFRFTWDGESAVGVTSGAGLGCLDLTAEGASAFVFRELKFQQNCDGKTVGCPMLEIQLRVFDGTDPTGQRYSTGVVRRRVTNQMRDLVIPFSQMARPGPEGPWRPSCVGAVTATFFVPPKVESSVSFLRVETNGACAKLTRGGRPDCDDLREANVSTPATMVFDERWPHADTAPSVSDSAAVAHTPVQLTAVPKEELFDVTAAPQLPPKPVAVPRARPTAIKITPASPQPSSDQETFGSVAG